MEGGAWAKWAVSVSGRTRIKGHLREAATPVQGDRESNTTTDSLAEFPKLQKGIFYFSAAHLHAIVIGVGDALEFGW
jgi:hypothetical protein